MNLPKKMMQSNYLMLFEKFNLFKSLLKDLIQGTRTSLNGTTEDMVLGTLEQIKSYLIENKNDNKLLKPFDIQLCNLTWEVILFYKVNKEYTSRFLNDFIELFVDIEFCVNDGKSEILIMERLFCPRNTYFLKSIQNKECMIDELKSLLEQTFIHRKKTISNTQNTSKNNVTTTEAMLQLSMS